MKEKFLQFPRQSRLGHFHGRAEKKQSNAATSFEELAAGSIRDLSFLVNGVVDVRILVPLRRRDGLTGCIVVEVGVGDQEIEVSVIASNFPAIKPSTDGVPLALPLGLLFKEEQLADWEWASLTPEQEELRKALRWACAEELKVKRARERQGGQATSSSETIALHARHLMEKRRFWKTNRFRHVDARGAVFFERRYDQSHDARLLVLVRADDDHELAPLLDSHEEVAVDMWCIFDEYRKPQMIRDLRDVAEARKQVAQYVARILPKIGYIEREVTGRK